MNASANYAVLCLVTAYDVYSANASLNGIVQVMPQTQNRNSLVADLADQLTSANTVAQPDVTKRVIATAAAVLNSINCTSTPNCTSLHRSPCASTSHTCGACISGYLGDAGDGNSYCTSVSSLQVRVSAGSACASSSTCGAWQQCINSVCVQPSANCSMSCFAHGSCSFRSRSTGVAVSTCLAGDSTCTAVCSCASGYEGDNCEYTSEDMASRSSSRTSLLQSLQDLTTAEKPTLELASSWSDYLATLTSSPSELTSTGSAVVQSVASTILSTISDKLGSLEMASGVLQSVDASVTAQRREMRTSAQRRRLTSSNATDLQAQEQQIKQLSDLMTQYSSLVLNDMVVGQSAVSSIQNELRIVSMVQDVSARGSTVALSTPLSSTEIANGVQPHNVSLSVAAGAGNVMVSAIMTQLVDYGQVGSAYTANPLSIHIFGSQSSVCGVGGCNVTVRLMTASDQSYLQNMTSPLSIRHTCPDASLRNAVMQCPNNLTVSESCAAGLYGEQITHCPVLLSSPSCVLLHGSGTVASNSSCTSISFNSTHTDCICTLSESAFAYSLSRRLTYSISDFSISLSSTTNYDIIPSFIDKREREIESGLKLLYVVLISLGAILLAVLFGVLVVTKNGSINYFWRNEVHVDTVDKDSECIPPVADVATENVPVMSKEWIAHRYEIRRQISENVRLREDTQLPHRVPPAEFMRLLTSNRDPSSRDLQRIEKFESLIVRENDRLRIRLTRRKTDQLEKSLQMRSRKQRVIIVRNTEGVDASAPTATPVVADIEQACAAPTSTNEADAVVPDAVNVSDVRLDNLATGDEAIDDADTSAETVHFDPREQDDFIDIENETMLVDPQGREQDDFIDVENGDHRLSNDWSTLRLQTQYLRQRYYDLLISSGRTDQRSMMSDLEHAVECIYSRGGALSSDDEQLIQQYLHLLNDEIARLCQSTIPIGMSAQESADPQAEEKRYITSPVSQFYLPSDSEARKRIVFRHHGAHRSDCAAPKGEVIQSNLSGGDRSPDDDFVFTPLSSECRDSLFDAPKSSTIVNAEQLLDSALVSSVIVTPGYSTSNPPMPFFQGLRSQRRAQKKREMA